MLLSINNTTVPTQSIVLQDLGMPEGQVNSPFEACVHANQEKEHRRRTYCRPLRVYFAISTPPVAPMKVSCVSHETELAVTYPELS